MKLNFHPNLIPKKSWKYLTPMVKSPEISTNCWNWPSDWGWDIWDFRLPMTRRPAVGIGRLGIFWEEIPWVMNKHLIALVASRHDPCGWWRFCCRFCSPLEFWRDIFNEAQSSIRLLCSMTFLATSHNVKTPSSSPLDFLSPAEKGRETTATTEQEKATEALRLVLTLWKWRSTPAFSAWPGRAMLGAPKRYLKTKLQLLANKEEKWKS